MKYVLLGDKKYGIIRVESYRVLDLDIPIQVDPKQGLLCPSSEVILANDLQRGLAFESQTEMIHYLAFEAKRKQDFDAWQARMKVKVPGLEPAPGLKPNPIK